MTSLADNPLIKLAEKAKPKKDVYDHFEKDFLIKQEAEAKKAKIIATSNLHKVFGENLFGMVRFDDGSLNLDIVMMDLVALKEAYERTVERKQMVHRRFYVWPLSLDEDLEIAMINSIRNGIGLEESYFATAARRYGRGAAYARYTFTADRAQKYEMVREIVGANEARRYFFIPESEGEGRKLGHDIQAFAKDHIWCNYIEYEGDAPSVSDDTIKITLNIQRALRDWFAQ